MTTGPNPLPQEMLEGTSLRVNEYAWTLAAFPEAAAKAEALGYACLGGEFQFRLDDGSTCEMYWFGIDGGERKREEPWNDFVHRSCARVLAKFLEQVATTDFRKEASQFDVLKQAMERGVDLMPMLAFVAYFVAESEFDGLGEATKS